jgi:ABC-type antimicrobial peptide transport system permease subunit
VTPGYFRTTGLSIVKGRPFEEGDGASDGLVAVISQTMARALWPTEDPLGRCLMVGADAAACTTVVGVVEDAARGNYTESAYMGYYVPVSQAALLPQGESLGAPQTLYIRARDDADAVVAAATPILSSLTPEVRWARVRSMRDILDPQARSWTLGATMFIAFGLLAMTLAAIGLYAVLAFEVAQRTREFGIRVALGAERARLLRSVLARGGQVAMIGIVIGLAGAYAAAPFVQDLLFQVSPRDPIVLAVVAAALLLVSLSASLLPALRATRVDPVTALKSD